MRDLQAAEGAAVAAGVVPRGAEAGSGEAASAAGAAAAREVSGVAAAAGSAEEVAAAGDTRWRLMGGLQARTSVQLMRRQQEPLGKQVLKRAVQVLCASGVFSGIFVFQSGQHRPLEASDMSCFSTDLIRVDKSPNVMRDTVQTRNHSVRQSALRAEKNALFPGTWNCTTSYTCM